MNTIMGILRFGGKASLQLLKTAVSFAAGMVVTFCAFYGLVFLPIIRNRRNPLLFLGKLGVQSLMVAAFAGGFYLTFKLLEPKMAARKKLLVATLGIVLLPASVFALTYTPTLSIAELFRQSSPPGPPKPYEEAIYDVYSGLLNGEMTQRSLLNRLFDPPPHEVLIRVETLTFQDSGLDAAGKPSTDEELVPDKQFKQAVDAAVADYLKRNNSMLELQRRFTLPRYDLFTKAEEQSIFKGAAACLAFQQKHPVYKRWIELSAVGFNRDQTVALVSFVETSATKDFCIGGTFKRGQGRVLQNRGGKWHLLADPMFSDWIE